MFTEWEVGNHTYKLRLTTQGVINLEKELGYNPLQMFMGIDDDVLPKLTDMILVLHQMLQPYEHGLTKQDTFDIFEQFIQDGHTIWDLIPVLINVFVDAGFLPRDEEPKN